jgi:hypothetical protein
MGIVEATGVARGELDCIEAVAAQLPPEGD